jgi:hypothetical protein
VEARGELVATSKPPHSDIATADMAVPENFVTRAKAERAKRLFHIALTCDFMVGKPYYRSGLAACYRGL